MSPAAHTQTLSAYEQLRHWLLWEAYPLWASCGWDRVGRGFHERLSVEGPMAADARRARVQFRQIFCFARAAAFGCHGNIHALVIDGLDHAYTRYRRADGLMRTLLGPDGTVLDERAVLYDQAFALLALAESHRLLGRGAGCVARATELLGAITRRLAGRHGFLTDTDTDAHSPRLANPHMHLLEATLAWRALDPAPHWHDLAEQIVSLALEYWIDPANGVLREAFAFDEARMLVRSGSIEPGHQFEWAGLLLRFDAARPAVRQAALRLGQFAEQHGVLDGFAVNALNVDLTIRDPQARLWPQTERIKTLARLADLGEGSWPPVTQALGALQAYLSPAPGLWLDRRMPDGSFVSEPSPASSFYHIVEAVSTLAEVLGEH